MERQSLVEYLPVFLSHGNEVAYVERKGYRSVCWSYREVVSLAFRFARELELRGITKGERVAIWAPNSAEWVGVFLGCCLRGVVVVPLDQIATAEFVLRVHQRVGARLLVCSREHLLPSVPTMVLEDSAEALARHSSAPYVSPETASSDTLEIIFTSGTTAEPKGVVITHANVLANLAPLEAEIRKYLKYETLVHPIRFLNLLPLSHVFGQFLGIFLPPLLGAVVVFEDSLNPSEVIATVKREVVSVLVSVPRVLDSLKQKIERDLSDDNRLEEFRRALEASGGKHFLARWWTFRHIRRRFGWKFWAFISGGAALDSETEQFWHRLGYAVIQGYGLTETTSLVSVNHPFRLGRGSIGKVLGGREVRLAADGEILVRGGGIAAGYWNGNQMQAIAGEQGWYATGDIGEQDAEGNLYFKGRKKEVIVTPAGMNVYPEDLEAALRRQPEVKDAVVIALPREGNAEPCAVLIFRDSPMDPASVVKRANQSLAEYQRLNHWFVWRESDFPRTSTQKPKRKVIQEAVQRQFRQPTSSDGAVSPLAGLIARITGRSPTGLDANTRLDSDLSLSSLDRVELLSLLEDRYQVDLTQTRFAAVQTVGDLERMLRGPAPQRVQYHYPRWVLGWPVSWIRLGVHYLLLRPAVFLLGWPRVEGRQNLKGVRGPLLVISNHIGDVDPGFVLTALPAHLRHKLAVATGGEALEILRTPPATRSLPGRIYDRVRWALGVSLLNLFPLPREAGFRESFAYAGECVDRGYNLLVFPEGQHTTDGKLRQFRAGIGLLAHNLGIPIVPMRIDGLYERKQAGRKFAWPGQIRVKIGPPVKFSEDQNPAWVASELRKTVEEL
ncbi:MAG TPA: AMP-binding protein [Terriglobales bacterium]|nr:AMP-binding protein [Terriglobales bacterium]